MSTIPPANPGWIEGMTGQGMSVPPPQLSDYTEQRFGEYWLILAKGSNGYWYMLLQALEKAAKALANSHGKVYRNFGAFIVDDSSAQQARRVWNRKLGPGYHQHVHFSTHQRGFEGHWVIYELGQRYAGDVDDEFGELIQTYFAQGYVGIHHDPEPTVVSPRVSSAPAAPELTPTHIAQIGQSLIVFSQFMEEYKQKYTAHEQKFVVVEQIQNGHSRLLDQHSQKLLDLDARTRKYPGRQTVREFVTKRLHINPATPQVQEWGRILSQQARQRWPEENLDDFRVDYEPYRPHTYRDEQLIDFFTLLQYL